MNPLVAKPHLPTLAKDETKDSGQTDRKTVLIVDDDPIILKTMSTRLQAAGYNALTAREGSAAIAAIRTHRPGVILLDINFPPDVANGGIGGWDGLHLMQWLRSLEGAQQARFIIITADDVARLRHDPLAATAVALFQKPIDYDQLLETLARQLSSDT